MTSSNFIDKYLSEKSERYIFGCTEEAGSLVGILSDAGYPVKAIIDTIYPEDSFSGVPRLKLEQVPRHALILSAVTNSRPVDVARLLESKGYEHCDYFSFYRLSGLNCPQVPFWNDALQHYVNNEKEYGEVRRMLADEPSRFVFDAVVNFRNHCDLDFMRSFEFDIQDMYFEEFMNDFENNSVFFDLGAFDGLNTKSFLQHCPSGKSYLFEPIPGNTEQLEKVFSSDNRCQIIHAAVGNENGTTPFNIDGTASRVTEADQGVEVPILSLDYFCQENSVVPSFVKMDVEGSEEEVLSGAENIIRNFKPMLAVSVYHRVEHLVDLAKMLMDFNPDYKLYLKHYTQGYSETVLFAVNSCK